MSIRPLFMSALVLAATASFAQDLQGMSPAATQKILSVSGLALHDPAVLVVRYDTQVPYVAVYRSPTGAISTALRKQLITNIQATDTLKIVNSANIVLRVVFTSPTPPSPTQPLFTVSRGGAASPITLGPAVSIPGQANLYYYEVIDVSPRSDSLVYTVTPTNGFPAPTPLPTVITVAQPDPASFETEFGIFYVRRLKKGDFTNDEGTKVKLSQNAFGLRKPVLTLGRSQKLTLDAVTVFNGKDDISLGGALTYSTLFGRGWYETTRGIFGFPLKFSVTFGYEGLNLGRVDRSNRPFLGVGFSVPTTKL